MARRRLFGIALLAVIGACMRGGLPPVAVTPSSRPVAYLDDVAPILETRCVVCHSCYNAPCQLKLSSFEGLDRGGSKDPV